VAQWKLFPLLQLLLSGKKQCVRSLPTSGSRSHCKDISVQVRAACTLLGFQAPQKLAQKMPASSENT